MRLLLTVASAIGMALVGFGLASAQTDYYNPPSYSVQTYEPPATVYQPPVYQPQYLPQQSYGAGATFVPQSPPGHSPVGCFWSNNC